MQSVCLTNNMSKKIHLSHCDKFFSGVELEETSSNYLISYPLIPEIIYVDVEHVSNTLGQEAIHAVELMGPKIPRLIAPEKKALLVNTVDDTRC